MQAITLTNKLSTGSHKHEQSNAREPNSVLPPIRRIINIESGLSVVSVSSSHSINNFAESHYRGSCAAVNAYETTEFGCSTVAPLYCDGHRSPDHHLSKHHLVPAVPARPSRLVIQDFLNPLDLLSVQFIKNIKRTTILRNLLRLRRPQNARADILVLECPRQCELTHRAVQLLGNLGQLAHLGDLVFHFLLLELASALLGDGVIARALGDAVIVLAGEHALCEWRPDGRAVVVELEDGCKLALDAAVEHVVLGLIRNGWNEVVLVGDVVGVLNLERAPLGCTPGVGLTRADEVCERLDSLAHRRRVEVGAMGHDDIDMLHVQACETALHTFENVLATESVAVGRGCAVAEEDLRRNDEVVAVPTELLNRLSHYDLGVAIGVDGRRVEGVDAVVPSLLHHLGRDVDFLGLRLLGTKSQPSSEREYGYLHVLSLVSKKGVDQALVCGQTFSPVGPRYLNLMFFGSKSFDAAISPMF